MKAKTGLRVFLIVSIVILTILAIGNNGWSMMEKHYHAPETDPSYYIQDYDINMVVTENNTVEVEEIITAVFTVPGKHGIYRTVPLLHTMDIEENGKKKTVMQSIKEYNVEGNQDAMMSYIENGFVLRMGDPDAFQIVNEPSIFALSYTLDLGKDYAETFDMFYYNIVGASWQVPIYNLDYQITMPKDYDTSKIKMYRGKYGNQDELDTFFVSGNVIYGNEKDFLVGEALTLDIRLPENYFSGARVITYGVAEVCIYIAIAVFVAILVFFVIRARKHPIIAPVEFYPPDNMNPVQVSTILHGKAVASDIVSLIVYFASKKYITIKNGEKGSMILHKVKHISPREKNYVKKFFNRLFAVCDIVNLADDMDNEVNVEYIDTKGKRKTMTYDGLSTEIYECVNLANENKPVKKRFETRNLVFSIIGVSLVGVTSMIYTIGYSVSLRFTELLVILSFVLVIAAIYLLFIELGIHKICYSNKGLILNVVLLVWYIAYFVVMTLYAFESISYTQGYTHFVVCAIMLVSTIASAYIVTYSKKQADLLGKVLGFKNFILTCEKDRMDILLKDNPEYFYDILPYAYVMGISDEFIDRFEMLGFAPPKSDYYWGSFDRVYFHTYTTRANTISRGAIKAQTSARIGSGGSGGGGGFSGGGFGGGGGGSW